MSGETFQERPPTVWLLVDDRAGNASQCLGVAEALGLRYLKQDLRYTITGALPNYMIGPSFNHLTRDSRVNLSPPWPDLVIAAGRRTAPVARHIKKLNGGSSFLCQVMHPGEGGVDEFDLIAVPRHDNMAGANILQTTGAPHRVNAARLAEARREWAGRFDSLPKPWIALIVGGSTRRRRFTAEMARELAKLASGLAVGAGGSLLVSTSRRTGDAEPALLEAITAPAHIFRWGGTGANPYFGYLALADFVIVTGESVSMCSEACASPAPVYIYAPPKLVAHKFQALHEDLYRRGFARPLGAGLEPFSHPPLNAADEVAAAIRERMGLESEVSA